MTAEHPMQPVVVDEHGIHRFHANGLVKYLLAHGGIDLNKLAIARAEGVGTDDDFSQLMQLIGYSVSGAPSQDIIKLTLADRACEEMAAAGASYWPVVQVDATAAREGLAAELELLVERLRSGGED